MKQIKYVVLLILALLGASCEDTFLSPELTTGLNGDNYYTNDEEIETAVINIYTGIQGINASENTDSDANHSIQIEFYVTEMRSDNTRTKSREGEAAQFENYTVQPTNGIVADYYRSFYNVVFRANTVIDNISAASEANAAKFEGEAKFLRAYAYFNLVRLFGDIPLVETVIAPSDSETAYTRVATASIYELIIGDLKTAIDNLDNTYKDRASKAAAQALLAKVYLTLPTPDYAQAQILCEAILGSYSLMPNFYDVFYTELNSEIIFAIGFAAGDSNNSHNISAEWLNSIGRTSGVNYVTDEGAAALDNFGGDRTQYSYRQDPFQITENQVIKYLPNGEDGGDNGRTFESDPTTAGNDWVVLRYADVLLMHVEAILAGGPETSNSAAIASFQEVRDRAGLTDPVTNIGKQELLDERRVELAFENHRLFDLIRFGEAVEVLSEFSTNNGYSFSRGRDLLLPIPQREIGLSQGLLDQNPGY